MLEQRTPVMDGVECMGTLPLRIELNTGRWNT
jgi:hypothetical protein